MGLYMYLEPLLLILLILPISLYANLTNPSVYRRIRQYRPFPSRLHTLPTNLVTLSRILHMIDDTLQPTLTREAVAHIILTLSLEAMRSLCTLPPLLDDITNMTQYRILLLAFLVLAIERLRDYYSYHHRRIRARLLAQVRPG